MIVATVQQNTAGWLQWRRQGLGGSDSPVILGIPTPWPQPTPEQLRDEKLGLLEREDASAAAARGKRLEPVAVALYKGYTSFATEPLCVEYDGPLAGRWLRSSLDGWHGYEFQNVTTPGWPLLETTHITTHILEVKCPNKDTHAGALDGQVPPYYRCQVLHNAVSADTRIGHYWSYSDNKVFAKREQTALVAMTFSEDDVVDYLTRAAAFWRSVEAKRKELER